MNKKEINSKIKNRKCVEKRKQHYTHSRMEWMNKKKCVGQAMKTEKKKKTIYYMYIK